jgi:hypothetical protein
MRTIIDDGAYRLEILGKDDSVMKFRSIAEAVTFLRRFQSSPAQMSMLAAIAAEACHDARRPSTDQVLKEIASLLVSGRLKILRTFPALRSGTAVSQQEDTALSGGGPPLRKSSWVEINLLDAAGEPVAAERYKIKLPDASIQEGSLDTHGHVEFYSINAGSCEVSFPNLEDDDWYLS